ncbi:hypothetical protein Ate02nite_95560 [Paractinoplanes tereljensis]|uniref:Transposase n=1 Tax=Paractinoplanes tereljensis TaxID=571912 RepID=A0A919TXX0_9ACTN|nr:hypothetical protein Ate02nite_95560 [Actinoplanes tereljensis]
MFWRAVGRRVRGDLGLFGDGLGVGRHRAYPSDVTDEQWEIIEPMLPLIKEPRPDPEASVARHRKIAVADVCSG